MIRAEVVSSRNGVVSLKTENGNMLQAKPDADVILSLGDKVMLEVTSKEDGILTLAVRVEETMEQEKTSQSSNNPESVKDFNDKSLAPYADKLTELKMPVSEKTALLMRDLIAQNPGMSLDEAAFLASNKLGGDARTINAALAFLSSGEKTDAMIARLLALLVKTDYPADNAPTLRPAGEGGVTVTEVNPTGSGQPVFDGINGPLAGLLEIIRGGATEGWNNIFQGGPPADANTLPIIPQGNGNMQSSNVENVENIGDFFQNSLNQIQQAILGPQNNVLTQSEIQSITGFIGEIPGDSAALPVNVSPENNRELTGANLPAEILTDGKVLPDGATAAGSLHSPESKDMYQEALATGSVSGKALAEVLSQIPEFRGVPESALERFSNMLYRVALDSADTPKGHVDKLSILLDRLFTRIDKDNTTGERLRSAREELFTRIALIEEEVSRAAHPARAEMQEQVNRLTDHLRLLNNIDQFVYMQIPVIMGQDRKTAELYMFKKKGGKRADPENVNILLALDLENMGRWEALINFRNKDVSIQMEVRGNAEKKHFSENTVLLHELLAEAGFKLVNTDIKYSKEETTPLTALVALDRYTSVRAGAIDYMI